MVKLKAKYFVIDIEGNIYGSMNAGEAFTSQFCSLIMPNIIKI